MEEKVCGALATCYSTVVRLCLGDCAAASGCNCITHFVEVEQKEQINQCSLLTRFPAAVECVS